MSTMRGKSQSQRLHMFLWRSSLLRLLTWKSVLLRGNLGMFLHLLNLRRSHNTLMNCPLSCVLEVILVSRPNKLHQETPCHPTFKSPIPFVNSYCLVTGEQGRLIYEPPTLVLTGTAYLESVAGPSFFMGRVTIPIGVYELRCYRD